MLRSRKRRSCDVAPTLRKREIDFLFDIFLLESKIAMRFLLIILGEPSIFRSYNMVQYYKYAERRGVRK